MPQPEREWTLMFYFASDNALAPGIVSQLKAIKQAGFHQEVNVVAQFDPQPEGTPTHIFDVNHVNKLKKEKQRPDSPNQIGFNSLFGPSDPFVSNLIEDKLWREDQLDRAGKQIRERLKDSLRESLKELLNKEELPEFEYNPEIPPRDRRPLEVVAPPRSANWPARPRPGTCRVGATGGSNGNRPEKEEERNTRELEPRESLEEFLKFCREKYPARRYALFILGHGVVVGNDVFLFDENSTQQSLSLIELGNLLYSFKQELPTDAAFELVSFHSCSVSSLEVAYELKGIANYMLASQGPAFVGSWPYRQILMRFFKNADGLKRLSERKRAGGDAATARETAAEDKRAVKQMLHKIFSYCFHNSTDFLLAGYSFDVALCDLNRVESLQPALVRLSRALRAGLSHPLAKNFILLAHWEAQSHFQESYTDLHDFCFCLQRQCGDFLGGLNGNAAEVLGDAYAALDEIGQACGVVKGELEKEVAGGDEKVVVSSDFAGPSHQYTRGLSVYFPWSRPISDRPIMDDYACYQFAETTWLEFLESYFDKTRRHPRKEEEEVARREAATNGGPERGEAAREPTDEDKRSELTEDLATLVFNTEGVLSSENALANGGKTGPADPTGDPCTCQPIKNYPRETRARLARTRTPRAAAGDSGAPASVVPVSQDFNFLNTASSE